MANTKTIGETTEAIVLAEFVKAGFPVLLPFGDNQRYDLVIEAGGRFLRVQCKTAHRGHSGSGRQDGCIRFKARSGGFGPGDPVTSRSQPYRNQADLFAAYSPFTAKVYVLAVAEVPETDVWLRLTPAKHGNQYGIRLAEEHTLEAWAARQSAGIAP